MELTKTSNRTPVKLNSRIFVRSREYGPSPGNEQSPTGSLRLLNHSPLQISSQQGKQHPRQKIKQPRTINDKQQHTPWAWMGHRLCTRVMQTLERFECAPQVLVLPKKNRDETHNANTDRRTQADDTNNIHFQRQSTVGPEEWPNTSSTGHHAPNRRMAFGRLGTFGFCRRMTCLFKTTRRVPLHGAWPNEINKSARSQLARRL